MHMDGGQMSYNGQMGGHGDMCDPNMGPCDDMGMCPPAGQPFQNQ